MRKVTILLAVVIVAAQSVGCGCCNRMRDWLCRGAYCQPACAPSYAAVTAPCAAPAMMPMAAPMAMSAPCQTCGPCQTCVPMETSFEPGCAYGAGMPMYSGDSGGWAPQQGGMMMVPQGTVGDPAPAP